MINYKDPDYTDTPDRKAARYKVEADFVPDHIDVSVITPYYNTGEYFSETMASMQAQTLQNWEWVIVDDGSTDKASVERLAAAAAREPRIKVVRQANAGPGAARNTSFRNTRGRYVCLLDSDDLLEPTYLEKCAWFLDSNSEFDFCNTCNVVFGEQHDLWTSGFERGKAFLQANSGPPFSVIRREAFADCGGFDETILFGHEDWDFWLAMAQAGHWGHTIPEYLQWYRKRSDSRYEQIMRSGNANEEFEVQLRRKYQALNRSFPHPTRRCLKPYETIETRCSISNSLAANRSGRRILFLIPWMVTGGADIVNLNLVEGLTAKGHDVTICATLVSDHCWEHEFSRFTPDIFILPNFLHPSDYPRFLAYLIQSRKIDTVVLTQSTIGYYLLPYLRAVSPGIAFVDLCHVEEPHWLNGGHPRFAIGYQDLLDFNIVTSKHLAEWMERRGAEAGRIRVMYIGIRISRTEQPGELRRSVRAELGIPESIPVIVFAGWMCEQKRPAVLAKILKTVRDSGFLYRALIIGEGEWSYQLESLLTQYHLMDIAQVLNFVQHERLLEILAASDIFLIPSQSEGFSIALQESMAAGAVPVAARVGGHDEIVTPDAGVLIEHGDDEVQAYLNAVSRLLSNPAELHRMSEKCKSIAASKLSWESMIDNFLGLLEEAHSLRANHPRYPISPRFGLELVSLWLEYKRVSESCGTVWPTATSPPWTQSFARHAVSLSQTRLGKIAMRNPSLKAMGKWILRTISGS